MIMMVTTVMVMLMNVVTKMTAAAITKAHGRGDTGTVRASRSAGRAALYILATTVSINATVEVVWSLGTAVCCVWRILWPMYQYLVEWNTPTGPSFKVNGTITDADMVSGGIPLQLVVLVQVLSGAVALVVGGDVVLRTTTTSSNSGCIATRANSGATTFMDSERWCGPTLVACTRDTG
jgi:hypothetical protein